MKTKTNMRMKRITNETVDILTNLVIVLQDTCDYDQTFRFVLQFNLEDKIIFDCLLNPGWKGRPISEANRKIMVLAVMHQSIILKKYHVAFKIWK